MPSATHAKLAAVSEANLRGTLLRYLADPNNDRRFHQAYTPGIVARLADVDLHAVYAMLWALVGDGLAYPDPAGQGSSLDNWEWRLTPRGVRAARNQSWEPRDPERFLAKLTSDAPGLDVAAHTYVREALMAFNAGCYLASSVMLGVASEQTFNRIAAAFVAAASDDATKLQKLLENPRATYFARFQELRKRPEPMRDELPEDLADTLTLDAVADLLRVTRNNSGHPTGRQIDEDTAFTHLQMAGRYLGKMTRLAEHYEAAASR
jgi:hypothetical protein